MSVSTWEWIRVLGFLAYFYFTVAVIFGLLRKSSYVKSQKNLIYQIHQSASWMGFITLLAHMLVLMIDTYEPYSIVALLVPFASDYQTFSSTLGTIGFYLFLLVMFTSDLLLTKINRKLWKFLHLLVLPAWLLSLAHGLFIGTDSSNPLVLLFYGVTAGIAILIMVLRVATKDNKKKAAAPKGTTTQKTRSGVSHS